jgi:hypothetical protein
LNWCDHFLWTDPDPCGDYELPEAC